MQPALSRLKDVRKPAIFQPLRLSETLTLSYIPAAFVFIACIELCSVLGVESYSTVTFSRKIVIIVIISIIIII